MRTITTESSESITSLMKVLREHIRLILLSLIILAGLRMVSGQGILPPNSDQRPLASIAEGQDDGVFKNDSVETVAGVMGSDGSDG